MPEHVDTRPHDLAGCRRRDGVGCYPSCGCHCHPELEPWQAEILVEWWPSASIGESKAIRHLLEGWCGTLMERLQQLGVTDPTVELSPYGSGGVSSAAEAPPQEVVSRLHEAVTAAHDSGASAVTVDLPTGDDLLRLVAEAPPAEAELTRQDAEDLRWLVGHLLANNPAGNTVAFPPRLQPLLVACRDDYNPGRFTLANVIPAAEAPPRPGLTLWPDELDGGWVAECHLIPGCLSQGDTPQEALENVLDLALTLARMATDAGNRTPLVDVLAELGVTLGDVAGAEATENDDA